MPSADLSLKEAALAYHALPRAGKLSVVPTKPLDDARALTLAYSPGVAYACEAIVDDPLAAGLYTSRSNLVAVITNGTAVLGLGDIGPLASKPVMEGKACLFKQFAGVDVFDIELAENDPDLFIDTVVRMEPTFGGINLEDIKAPDCFYIEQELRKRMKIPVFHDDQHGTAIIVAAGILNGLELVGKQIGAVRVAVSGAGAASIACLDLLVSLGLNKSLLKVCDSQGVIYPGRDANMEENKARYANDTSDRSLADAMVGADIFIGVSKGGVVQPAMVASMAERPLIFALANPHPEISPEHVHAVRSDAIVATGRSDYPNQINNVLCFPYIFRGALDVGATTINEEMKLACVRAIAALAKEPLPGESHSALNPLQLIPSPFDPRLRARVAPAVSLAAINSGVATRAQQPA
ncbi:malic enzyme, NAD binding domain protein [Janthinobacterium agaricidamnosum NBRC 102515 = DSM 9628]|uniref:Malic enzyme, NAD binding domain protein n=1 Tax=Janthinobacterium agaricidamnosum NBRC 102515 = DSM 9628 TaxID=1349767 RepID=W0V1X9_9BURK|nr:malic enzyme, NAD binding domain protein [Janthinobacterium agaricidamnosum NBRC 102515 = DSM 9628]